MIAMVCAKFHIILPGAWTDATCLRTTVLAMKMGAIKPGQADKKKFSLRANHQIPPINFGDFPSVK